MAQEEGGTRVWWGLAAVVLAVLAISAYALFAVPEVGPPPPRPLAVPTRQTVVPVAPPPQPVEGTSQEMEARRERERKAEAAAAEAPHPSTPALRNLERAIAPLKIQRRSLGNVSTPRAGKMVMGTRFQGRAVPADVVVDGVYKGTTPMTLEMADGDYRVRLQYPGTQVNEFVTHVQGGRRMQMEVDLRAPGQKDAPTRNRTRFRE